MDPYEPPKANLRSELRANTGDLGNLRVNRRKAESRPVLLWVNQILLGIAIAGGIFNGMRTLANPGAFSSMGVAIAIDVWVVFFVTACCFLMYGLAVARRWSWHGCIAFSILLVIKGVSAWLAGNGASGGDAAEQAGQAFGRIFATVLFAINPFALFFSGKVRRFLGVDRPKAA